MLRYKTIKMKPIILNNKFRFLLLLLTLVLFVLVGCGGREMPEGVPNDFAFYYADWINENQKNILDTYEGILQKDLIQNGIAQETYTPTDETLTAVYQKIVELGLQNLTGDYRTDAGLIQPMTCFEIRFTMDGQTCEILANAGIWGAVVRKDTSEDAEKIEEFCHFMSDVLRETEEYASLPEREGGYM